MSNKKPHKHAELIKAWADGAEIQYQSKFDGIWTDSQHPEWAIDYEYRIKPEPKPDNIRYGVALRAICSTEFVKGSHNLKLTFDGETGKLKSAEVL